LARFEVAAVTGANSFFSLSADDVKRYQLEAWARPLLPRTRYAPGLRFSQLDFEALKRGGHPAFLFDAGQSEIAVRTSRGLQAYLADGERLRLPDRYKCRIRDPWYAIPYIKHGELLLSKRCHRYPRLILNETPAVTTDTIYRGRIIDGSLDASDLVVTFHNSLTLLSAELVGRNFGGGVLELVPSEVARLQVPVVRGMNQELDYLDGLSREANTLGAGPDNQEPLVYETDVLLAKADVGLSLDLLRTLSEARSVLVQRRMDRASRPNI